jgi:hypothetical protein
MSGALVSTVVVGFVVVFLLGSASRWAYGRLRREFMEDGDAGSGGDEDDEGGAKVPLGCPAGGDRDGGGGLIAGWDKDG